MPIFKLLRSELLSGFVQQIGFGLQNFRDAKDLLIGFTPALLFNCFAHAGKRLYAVAGIEAGRVDEILEPGPIRKASRVAQQALALNQLGIDGRSPVSPAVANDFS